MKVNLDWQSDAACRGEDPELFFAPEIGRARDRLRREAQAKAICARCPVRAACLEWRLAFEHQRDAGIWGGMNEQERWSIRQRRVRAAAERKAAA